MSFEPARVSPPAPEELPRMSLMEHLEELRKRILWSLVGIAAAFFPCWNYAKEIFAFLVAPLKPFLPPGTRLAFLGLTDPFIMYFKMAALAALFIASPFVLYQAWQFIAPGLYPRERRYALPFVLVTTAFFLSGGAFGYYVAFPAAAKFLLGIASDQLQPVITVTTYFGFLMTIILGLGLMFELPVVLFLLSLLGVVTPRFLIKQFRWAVVIIFIVAAIVTPTPDIFNQCVFAVPGIALYLVGVGAAALATRSRDKRRAAAEAGG
jgi:sec-independent protein translocase protein TatC